MYIHIYMSIYMYIYIYIYIYIYMVYQNVEKITCKTSLAILSPKFIHSSIVPVKSH